MPVRPRLLCGAGVLAIILLVAVAGCSDRTPAQPVDAEPSTTSPSPSASPSPTCITTLWREVLDVGPTGVGFRDAAAVDRLPPCVPITVQVTFYDIVGQYVINRLGAVETEYTGEADPDAAPRPAEASPCARLLTIVVDGDRPVTDDDVSLLLLPTGGGPLTYGLDRDDIVTAWYDPPPESSDC